MKNSFDLILKSTEKVK
jgi:hypothetical protein